MRIVNVPAICSQWNHVIPILAIGMNSEEVKIKLQEDLDRLYVWFARNKLSVKCSKTVSILLTSNRSKYKHDILDLNLLGEPIEQVSSAKYLRTM